VGVEHQAVLRCDLPAATRLMTSPRRSRGRGFTILESLLAAAVLTILAAGVGQLLAASYQQTLAENQTATAVALGRQLLEEIACKPLLDPATGNTTPLATAKTGARSAFTGAGDYNLYSDHSTSLTTLGGATENVTTGQTYTRSVSVQLGATPTGDSVSPTSDFAVVTVTVTTPLGQTVKLQRLLTNYVFTR
jgi:prepilin-type N-terminal cleavage/methylation domain-containing protein